jgi:DNA topoisomerase-3
VERREKILLPTEKGINLIKVLPESVKSPRLTAEWENHLKRIERGELSANDFMVGIKKYVGDTIKTYSVATDENRALFPSSRQNGELIGKCLRCGGDVAESTKGFFCVNRSCKFGLFKDSKFFAKKKKTLTKEVAKALIEDGRIFMPGLMSEKTGKPYSATIMLDDNSEGYTGFKMVFERKEADKNEQR